MGSIITKNAQNKSFAGIPRIVIESDFAGEWVMVLVETLFHRGEPIGKISQDLFAGEVRFIPNEGHKRLAQRKWSSVNACQRAVLKHYTKEDPRD